jgi:phage terminase large subunit-like protein
VIWEAFSDAAEKWPTATFVVDPKLGGDIFAERIEAEYPNCRVSTFEQMPGPLARMARRLSDAIAEKRIQHPDDQVLNAHVLAGAAKQVGETWRFAKQRRKEMPIDALIALAMAFDVLTGDGHKPQPSVAHFL